MINVPFSSEFYTVFPAPNSDELISKIDDVCNTQQVDNDFFEWGRYCKVDRIPLIWQDFLDLFKPCLLYTSPSPRDVEESRMPSSA